LKANKPVVEFERVTVSYDRKTPVLKDVSLKVFEGEMIFIIGPNGGGKSTLLKTIVGSLRPEKGRVKLFGVDVSRFRDWWMVGYLPQNAATLFEKMPLNVSELLTAAAIHRKGMEPAEAVKLVGVEDPTSLLNKRVTDLSGGMLQKTMLALALINNPKILLLDEPTVYVDQTGVGAFMRLLTKLHVERELTIVIATHDVTAISTLASRVICINRESLYDGTLEQLITSEQLCNIYGFHVYTLRHGHAWSGE